MTRTAPLLMLLSLAVPASADPVDDLSRLVKRTAESPDALVKLFDGVASLPDFDLGPAEVRRLLDGAPSDGVVGKLLGPTRRFLKRGDRLEVHREAETRVTNEKGVTIVLSRKIEARLTVSGPHDAVIDKIEGIRAGKTASSLYDLWKLQLTREDGKPVARVTAGTWIFFQTKTVDLTPKPKPPAPNAGLAGAVAAS